jgi:hypothetical protein
VAPSTSATIEGGLIEHLTKNIEELIVTGGASNHGPIHFILLIPVHTPQLEIWISVVEGLPQFLKILFRVTNGHGGVDLAQVAVKPQCLAGVLGTVACSAGMRQRKFSPEI